MGFAFNLAFPFVLTAFLLSVFVALVISLRQKKGNVFYWIMGSWGLLAVVFWGYYKFINYSKPMRLSRTNIEGEYRIDTTFYPGFQAHWQYKHIKFRLDSIHWMLNMKFDYGIEREFVGKVNWKEYSNPQLWEFGKMQYENFPEKDSINVNVGETVPVLGNTPVLYRSNSRFYYVFEDTPWGNLFFRKVENPDPENW